MKYTDQFKRLWPLTEDLELLDHPSNTIYAVTPDLQLVFTNDGWDRFADDNVAPPDFKQRWNVGCSIAAALISPSGQRAQLAIRAAFETGEPQTYEYECSSPERQRFFTATFQPVAVGKTGAAACVVTHAERVDHPPEGSSRQSFDLIEARYTNEHGIVTQCSECRRVSRVGEPVWDWVPGFVEHPPPLVSHGLCEGCVARWMMVAPE